ncbi:addiction module protein [Haloferula sp. BvORR071]|uniref:addiction module protein n=1 Tax=Haloferula sp. BvORR071 TaxID=1396141 RepID=UPI0005533F4E|nr:addiction module protein [Haloferula sp. BvORR071]
MSIAELSTRDLSRSDKIALMERLWGELSADEDLSQPPDWHAGVIESRAHEWERRNEVGEDWEELKKVLRSQM